MRVKYVIDKTLIVRSFLVHFMYNAFYFDLIQVLDEEAEVFVVKMWRLLIYETEAKKLGLVK